MGSVFSAKQHHYDLWRLLTVELLSVPIVILIFTFIHPKNIAGMIAGSGFVLMGVVFIYWLTKWPKFKSSLVFWFALGHLVIIALPMFITRVVFFDTPFDEITVLGFPGPIFHQISENVFLILILTTVRELWLTRPRKSDIQENHTK